MKYAMFLRGVNVGGIRVPMADLKVCLSQLSLARVKTYLQTGNVTFESEKTAAVLKPAIEKALGECFSYQAFVHILPLAALSALLAHCPFQNDPGSHRYVVFCDSEEVVRELAARRRDLDFHIEDISAGDGVIYWRVPIGSSTDTAFSKVIAQPKYKPLITNRNFNTLKKMLS